MVIYVQSETHIAALPNLPCYALILIELQTKTLPKYLPKFIPPRPLRVEQQKKLPRMLKYLDNVCILAPQNS